MDEKQDLRYISHLFWGGNIHTEYNNLFTTSLKYKQGFKTVINWARSEKRFIVAHPNERGTNIALIILPQNKASICTQTI